MAKKAKIPFERLPRDEQAGKVAEFMAAGGSYRKAAKAFKTSIGRIAGLCRDYHIASSNPPAIAPRALQDELKDNDPNDPRPKPPYKMAPSEAQQCAKCGILAEEGGLCRLHAWEQRQRLKRSTK